MHSLPNKDLREIEIPEGGLQKIPIHSVEGFAKISTTNLLVKVKAPKKIIREQNIVSNRSPLDKGSLTRIDDSVQKRLNSRS